MGVRCFELVSEYYSETDSYNKLENSLIWCGGATIPNVTFGSAMEELVGLLNANPKELLIIICNYQAYELKRSPQMYMNAFCNSYRNKYSNVVALEPNSTVGDLRGKIAFVGRISQEGEDSNLELSNLPDWFVYIKGWGSLKDRWNKRYGSSYNPAYAMSYSGSTLNVEDRLWETGSSENSTSWTPTPSGYPTQNVNFNYNTSKGGIAWVQEWMRVVPDDGIRHYNLTRVQTNISWDNPTYSYLHINWPGSYNEKKGNIITTFEKSKNEQDRLYINSLSGYYVDNDNADSYTPLKYTNGSSVTVNRRTYDLGKGNGGLGGTFDTYNNKINEDVFDYIYGQVQANTTGPMGIVMMDYIGANTKSTQLPALIYQNNFKFPLKTGSGTSTTPTTKTYDASYGNGGNAIGWE